MSVCTFSYSSSLNRLITFLGSGRVRWYPASSLDESSSLSGITIGSRVCVIEFDRGMSLPIDPAIELGLILGFEGNLRTPLHGVMIVLGLTCFAIRDGISAADDGVPLNWGALAAPSLDLEWRTVELLVLTLISESTLEIILKVLGLLVMLCPSWSRIIGVCFVIHDGLAGTSIRSVLRGLSKSSVVLCMRSSPLVSHFRLGETPLLLSEFKVVGVDTTLPFDLAPPAIYRLKDESENESSSAEALESAMCCWAWAAEAGSLFLSAKV